MYYSKLEKQCKKCYRFESCIQCIFNLKNLEDNPVCHGFMSREDFNSYKVAQLDFLRRNPEEYYRIMEEVVVE